MSQLNPKQVVHEKWITLSETSAIQQVGIDLSLAQKVELEHGCSVNVLFNESITLPVDVYADFKQRSSFSRKGIFATTGIYDPGYVGSLGCTIYNLSGGPITIDIGQRIGQIICYKADSASAYNGQWQNT